MSQHLIHVCVTDAPAWSQREGGKSKRTQKSNQTGAGQGKEGDGEKRNTMEQMKRRREKRKQTRKQRSG